jgi:predicted nuclease with TOPRIM domain
MTLINAMTLDNLVDLVKANPELKPFYEATRDFQEVIKQQDGDRNERMKGFGNKLNDFKAAFKGDSKAIEIFNELVGRSTIEEVDPTKPSNRYEKFGYSYTDKNGKAVEKVIYNTATERDEAVDALDRTVVRAGVRKLNSTPERVAEYKKVKKLYESLTPKQQTTYREIRDMYKKMNEEILESIDAKLDDLNLESAVKETVKEKAFRKILNSGVIDPYFKLDRTGDYWVEFKYKTPVEGTDYGVSAHVTPGARKIAIRNLRNNPM